MKLSSKAVLFAVAFVAGYFLVVHGSRALDPSLPKDMPQNAHFVQSGFDIEHSEAQGQWIACRDNHGEENNYCRITDLNGTVVYEGAFVPYDHPGSLPDEQLHVSNKSTNIWITGPAKRGPIPVIPMRNGEILVPVQDREALLARWSENPAELRQIAGI